MSAPCGHSWSEFATLCRLCYEDLEARAEVTHGIDALRRALLMLWDEAHDPSRVKTPFVSEPCRQLVEPYLKECSICRSRHGQEIRHVCE